METWIQKSFRPLKRHLPKPVSGAIRSLATASYAPYFHFFRSGHTRSSFATKAVDRAGNPLPWYSYPCIEFLARRTFAGRSILEFGAGQSTLWWSSVAANVVALEGDPTWHEQLAKSIPANVDLHHAPSRTATECTEGVDGILTTLGNPKFDIVVIDGLWREQLVPIARAHLKEGGAVICDNASGYNMKEAFLGSGFSHVDFYGPAPGVILPSVTSIFFTPGCFLFDEEWPIELK